ncbi:MAG: hypothetical protein ACRC3Z_00505 [Phocaeicola sp.]
MAKKELNINKQFMIGNGMLAFAVFAIVIIFTYMAFSLKRDPDKVTTYQGIYLIEFSKEWVGQEATVYLNDSLLWDEVVPSTPVQMKIKQWSDENVLLIVNKESDLASPFNLRKEGSHVRIKRQEEIVSIVESEASNLLNEH